jgi:succinyl-diaminopimelate desuccinylase
MEDKRMREIIDLTKGLIRFPSVHGNWEALQRCVEFVEKHLADSGARYQRFDNGNTPSLLVLPEGNSVPVLFMSHLDVVAAPAEQFEPFEEEGRLYGRGSLDDKYAVALSLVLLRQQLLRLCRAGRGQEDLPFGLLITSDEEMGGFDGAGELLRSLRPEFAIVLDGGGPQEMVVKQKGFVKLRLTSSGRTAHGSEPWLGENAIDVLIDDILKVRRVFRPSSTDHWHRTANLSILHSGRPGEAESFNQVPDRAEAVLDIRYTEKDDIEALLARLEAALTSEMEVAFKGPLFQGGSSPYLDLLLDTAKDARLGVTHSASDARFLTQYGINGIVWGADGEGSAHSETEHVQIDSVYQLYEILDQFVRRI